MPQSEYQSKSTALRNRYVSVEVDTMSPARLLLALYDRVLLDLARAIDALAANDVAASHISLLHAQEIISELHDSLNVEIWPPGQQLGQVYRYVLNELITANINKDARRVVECRRIIEPLRDAWREASGVVTSSPGNAA